MLLKKDKHIQEVVSYIEESLGIKARYTLWNDIKKLPILLQELYEFYTLRLNKRNILLFINQSGEDITPGKIAKHCAMLLNYWGKGIIYSTSMLSATDRFRLIKAKVPFIIPKKQLYLPFLGIDFKEIFNQDRKDTYRLSPTAQVLILGKLYKYEWIEDTPSMIAARLGITKMSIGRAFTELANTEQCKINLNGREKRLKFLSNGRNLWEKMLPILRSPVTSTEQIAHIPKGLKYYEAGLSGLSKYTMIQSPPIQSIAIWNRSGNQDSSQPNTNQILENNIILEKWSYNPGIFTNQKTADSLSIYLSLKDNEDERIDMALSELLEKVEW